MVPCLEVLPPWPLRSATQAANANTNELRRRASLSASVSTPSSTVPTHPPVNHPSAPTPAPNIKPVPATAPVTTPTTVTPATAASITTIASSSIIPTPIPAHLALGASPTPLPVKPPTAPIPQFDLNNNIRPSQAVSNEEPSTPSSSQSLVEPSLGNVATGTPPPSQPAPIPISAPSSSRKRSRASFVEPATTTGDTVAEENLPTSARKKERTNASKVTFTAIGSSSSPQATNLKRKDRKKASSNGIVAPGSNVVSPAGIESVQTSPSVVATFPATDSNVGAVLQSTSGSNSVGDELDGRLSEHTQSFDLPTQAGLSATDFLKNPVSETSGAPSIDSPQIPQSLSIKSNPSQLESSHNAKVLSGTSEAPWAMAKPSSDLEASSNEPSSVADVIPAKETKPEAQPTVVVTSSVYIKTSSIPISSVLESPISNEPPTKIPEPIPTTQNVPSGTETFTETSSHFSALLNQESIDIPDSAARTFTSVEIQSSALNVNNETTTAQSAIELSSKYAAEDGEDIVMQESGALSGEVEAGEVRESGQGQPFESRTMKSLDLQKSSENVSDAVAQTTSNGTNDMDIDEQPGLASTVETSSAGARDTVPQELPVAENLDLNGADNSGNQANIGGGTTDFAPPSSTSASYEVVSQLSVSANVVAVDANPINEESTSESAAQPDLPLDDEVKSASFSTVETTNFLATVETYAPTREAVVTDVAATVFGVDQSTTDFAPTAIISNPSPANSNTQDASVFTSVAGNSNAGDSSEHRSEPSIAPGTSANDGEVNTLETSPMPPILTQLVSNSVLESASGLHHTNETPINAGHENESSGMASEAAKDLEAGLVSEDLTAVVFQPGTEPPGDIVDTASVSLPNSSNDGQPGNSEQSREPVPKKPSNPLDHVKVALQLIQKESVLLVGTVEALPTTQSPLVAPVQSTYHSSLIDPEPVSASNEKAVQPILQEAELEEGEMAPTPAGEPPLLQQQQQQQFETGTPQQVAGRSGRRGSVKGAKALVSALSSSSSAASLQADLSDGEVVATEEEALVDKKKCAYCQTSVTPMWRRGPGGAGTLCNACGMKWAKKKM
ncbi:hypothetical protein HDU81_011162 [Chytriomyces hyalinus]|nr:hypothetical protein HDU81_011162 [Chytriomyces hyalinus]